MTKQAYTPDERQWKPVLTEFRCLVARASTAVFEDRAGLMSEIESKRQRLIYLDEVQAELTKWERRLGLVRTAEQLRLLVVV